MSVHAIFEKRNQAHREEGALAQTFRVAMRIWDEQKEQGVPLHERVLGLSKSLRACWPQTREWKFICHRCDDRGLAMETCQGDHTCGRSKPHLPHDFGRPCTCSVGNRFKAPAPALDDYAAAGKSRPAKKGFTSAWSR